MPAPFLRHLLRATSVPLATALAGAVLVAVPATAKTGPGAGPDLLDPTARRDVSVTITGDGFGHGKGMSQYGALGAAQQGLGYRQILDFYYPTTSWGQAGGQVRVLITDDTSRDVVVLGRRALTVTALESGRSWTPRRDAARWRIQSADGGKSVISFREGAQWREWRTVAGDAEFTASGKPITLVTPDGQVAYRGALRSSTPWDAATGSLDRDTVNVVALDTYVKGVVPQEVPALWPTATVRSQAVAARTYAAFERAAAPGDRHYQLCDTAQCQVYGGLSAEQPQSNAAVNDTAGKVLTFEGQVAFTQFSASNGGWMTAGDYPYLVAKEDPYDQAYRDWSVTLDGAAIARHWPAIGSLVDVDVVDRDANGTWVMHVTVTGTQGSTTVTGSTFASYVGLKSYFFDDPVVA